MAKRQAESKSRKPEVEVIRSFSATPGDPAELEEILLRWDLILAKRAIEQLRNEELPRKGLPR